jgi:hypothetical protein
VQYHSLAAIVRGGQWNALRHGHYAYYSAAALTAMLAWHGFSPRLAWQFDLYGGTVLLAASRPGPGGLADDGSVAGLLADEARAGIRDPTVLSRLQRDTESRAKAIHDWLVAERAAGRSVVGYGAASRAVALLRRADAGAALLPVVLDASPAKQGLRMPGTDIPVASPEQLADRPPDSVLLFVSDLRDEVRTTWPCVEAAGGRWVDADALGG